MNERELELLVSGIVCGALRTHPGFSDFFKVTPVMEGGNWSSRMVLAGQLGKFEIAVRKVAEAPAGSVPVSPPAAVVPAKAPGA